jgi:hypothetical protein
MKIILISILLLTEVIPLVLAQDNEVKLIKTVTDVPQQDLCKAAPVSHWSICLKGGGNYFNIPPDAIKESDRFKLSYGADLDYAFNPLVGIGLEYVYSDYSRPYTYMGVNYPTFNAGTHDAVLYASFNLCNVLFPRRSGIWKSMHVYTGLGGGVSYYESHENWRTVSSGSPTFLGKLNVSIECALSRVVSLNLNGDYRQYNTNRMTSGIANRNCDGFVATMGFRFKFTQKGKLHARDMQMSQYPIRPKPVVVTKTFRNGDTEETLVKLNAVRTDNILLKQKWQRLTDEQNQNGQ